MYFLSFRIFVSLLSLALSLAISLNREQQQFQKAAFEVFGKNFQEVISRVKRSPKDVKDEKYFPVPDNAKSPEPENGKSYYLGKATDDVYWVAKTGYVGMFVVTDNGVVVVDAPPNIGADFLDAIKEVTNKSVTHLIYSHAHIDHIGSATIFKNVEIVAHEETAKILQQRKDPNRPVPTLVFFGNSTILHIGGKTIHLHYKGPMHTPGNIFVWLPEESVLFTCDIINPGWAPFTRLGVAEDVVAFLEADDVILSYNFTYLIAGHWGKMGTRKDVDDHKEYLQDLQKNALEAAKSTSFEDIAKQVKDPYNLGLVLDLYLRSINKKCADMTAEKWKSRLGGVDIYSEQNCDTISMAQMIDYGMQVIE